MNGITARMRSVTVVVSLVAGTFLQSTTGAETFITRTNWVDRNITNFVEVRMPKNVFVNEYRTNWVEQVHTNVVTRELPRKVTVDFVHTNLITHYSTNYINKSEDRTVYIDIVSTNFVDHFRTNLKVLHLTNDVAVNLVRTNFVERYRTNWQTLTFTNFETVLVMKTNWVTQPVTNTVRIDLAAPAPAPAPVATAKPEHEAAKSAVASSTASPILEGAKSGIQSENGLVEVLLKVRWPAGGAEPSIQQWKIEREDGAFMSFGQEQVFKKELPIGSYKIEVRFHSASVAVLRGSLVVTANEVVVRQKPAGKRLASIDN